MYHYNKASRKNALMFYVDFSKKNFTKQDPFYVCVCVFKKIPKNLLKRQQNKILKLK